MSRGEHGQFSNTDNMGVVGVLSTQLLHHEFVRQRPTARAPRVIRKVVDRVGDRPEPQTLSAAKA
jgi:hypothetical protein